MEVTLRITPRTSPWWISASPGPYSTTAIQCVYPCQCHTRCCSSQHHHVPAAQTNHCSPQCLKLPSWQYRNPQSSGTFFVSDQENIAWDPVQKILKILHYALYSPKHYPSWAKYKEMPHSCYTYFYITPDAPWFVMLSRQNWNLTPHCLKGVCYLFSAPANVIRCRSRCSYTVDEGNNSAVLLHYYRLMWGAGPSEGITEGRGAYLVLLNSSLHTDLAWWDYTRLPEWSQVALITY